MIIPISVASQSSNRKLPPGLAKISHDEVVLIELQGSLEVECTDISERDGKLVGKLKMDETTNRPTLLIGHHLLEGKIVTLPKPLAVLHRSDAVSSTTDNGNRDTDRDENMDIDDDRSHVSPNAVGGWDLIAVVKRKILFSKRPMPVVGRPKS